MHECTPSTGGERDGMRMRRFSFLAAGLLAALTSLLAASTSTAADSGVRVWLTTGDKTSLLSEQPASALGPPVDGAPTITVEPSQVFQRIAGFGASITDSS